MTSNPIDFDAIKRRIMLAAGTTNFTRALDAFGIKSASFYGAARKGAIPATWQDKARVNLNVDPRWLLWGFEEGEFGAIEAELRRRNAARAAGEYPTGSDAAPRAGEVLTVASQTYDPTKHWYTKIYGPRGAGITEVATEHQPVGVVTSQHGGLENGRVVEYGAVPRAAARASAGAGLAPEPGSMGLYAFRRDWLDDACRNRNCVLLEVSGDSMEPDLRDRDLVLVDGDRTRVEPGRIYAVELAGGIVVKRLDIIPGRLVLRSSNPAYQPVPVQADDPAVRILGRAVWVGREI